MTAKKTRIVDLASAILEMTTTVDDYLRESGLTASSFNASDATHVVIPPEAVEIESTKRNAIEASMELTASLQRSTALSYLQVLAFPSQDSPQCFLIILVGEHNKAGSNIHVWYAREGSCPWDYETMRFKEVADKTRVAGVDFT